MQIVKYVFFFIGLLYLALVSPISLAQTPPTAFDYEGYDRAFKTVYDGDIEQVKRLLNNGFPLDKRDGSQRTALHIAAYQSHVLWRLFPVHTIMPILEAPGPRRILDSTRLQFSVRFC